MHGFAAGLYLSSVASQVDLVNRNLFELTHEDDRPQLYALLQSVDTSNQHIQGTVGPISITV